MTNATTGTTTASDLARNGIAAAWGAAGVAGICVFAVWRLTPIATEALSMPLTALQWLVLVANTGFMAWSEGYRGFQQKFAPRAAARALYVLRTPMSLGTRLLAPLFCFGYFHATRRARLVAWIGTFGILSLVVIIQQLDQPWRGIIDAGVVIGLSWGVVSLAINYYKAFRSGEYPADPEVERSRI